MKLDPERIFITFVLLLGWAIWTIIRHMLLPALVVAGGLLLVVSGWRPVPVADVLATTRPAQKVPDSMPFRGATKEETTKDQPISIAQNDSHSKFIKRG